jgi:hypothetical protein
VVDLAQPRLLGVFHHLTGPQEWTTGIAARTKAPSDRPIPRGPFRSPPVRLVMPPEAVDDSRSLVRQPIIWSHDGRSHYTHPVYGPRKGETAKMPGETREISGRSFSRYCSRLRRLRSVGRRTIEDERHARGIVCAG